MSSNDILANALSKIDNSIITKKETCTIGPVSKLIKDILEIMKFNHYIGEIEELTKQKGTILKINLIGGLNKCGVIKPRYPVKTDNFEKFEKRYLPSRGFGYLIVSTSEGIMTHEQAIKKNLGGKLIAYFY
tara:strand:+ start:68 stop:460 length:393 start_codon:yes stop_codon:yes gene_type:complete